MHLKIPPLLQVFIVAVLMYAVDKTFQFVRFDWEFRIWLAIILAIPALMAVVVAKLEFDRANTTINPMRPHKATKLVDKGLYRYSRNPMYLGFLILLIAWAIGLGNMLTFLLLPMYIWFINRYQIEPEEAALRQKFGDTYDLYCAKVKRWI